MEQTNMTSLERVLKTLGHEEPDRVPFFLLLSMHGAKELNLSIKDYFSKAENVVEGQLRLREKYKHDCIYPFFYGGIEIEAMGGDVIYSEDGPPNVGVPIIQDINKINDLEPISIENSPSLNKALDAISSLKIKVGNDAPILGVAISPFSLPIMQLGFSKYIELIYEEPELFDKLMKFNELFCVNWANTQFEAGATAVTYFDPVSSPTIVPKEKFFEKGLPIAKRTISQFNGPAGIHLASGSSLAISEELAQVGAAVIGVSTNENLTDLKEAFKKKLQFLVI